MIAILASLLLPALAGARSQSRRTSCLSNLRQLAVAFSLDASDNAERFPDRRELKAALGYRPWTSWPPSDPRGGWAGAGLSNLLASDAIWRCPETGSSPLRNLPQCRQEFRPGNTNAAVGYWFWRFDRIDDLVPLDNFWGKTVEQCVSDLRTANNPQVGQPAGPSEVEFAVDPYFPATIATVPADARGLALHPGGRNRLFLDYHAGFARDPRLK